MDGGGEPTEEERAEMERIRAEFLDVDDLPEGMSVPASVPLPGEEEGKEEPNGSKEEEPNGSGSNAVAAAAQGSDSTADADAVSAMAAGEKSVSAMAAGEKSDPLASDATAPLDSVPSSAFNGVDARVRFDARSESNPPGVATNRARLQAIFEREMDETREALLGGVSAGGAADDVNDALSNDARETAPPPVNDGVGDDDVDGPDAPRTLRETRDRLPFSPTLNDELMDALTSVVNSSRAGGSGDAREMMAAASARWEARRGAGGRARRDPMNTRAGRAPTTATEEEEEPDAAAKVILPS